MLHAACAAVANILTLPENDEVMVVGTVYKDMKLKPSILDEYVKVCIKETTASAICVLQQHLKLGFHTSMHSGSFGCFVRDTYARSSWYFAG